MEIVGFSFPTAIRFGAGARKEVSGHLRERGFRRPLLVTDKALSALPLLQEFRSHLNDLDVRVFAGVDGNPLASQAMQAGVALREHAADCVIGFGGGAALDVAKVAGLAARGNPILEYAWDHSHVRAVPDDLPYLVALPTTAGTGSEVGRSAVISEDATHIKRVIFAPQLLARSVFADPELTLELPAPITAATGMDALTHNVESYLSTAYHPMCEGIALEGARIAARALPRAVAEPHDLTARSDMMMASLMGAVAFQKDLGAVHACAHALGAVCGLHHGLANALMIDTVLAWNQPAAVAKFDALAHVCGAIGGGEAFAKWLKRLRERIDLGGGLAARGVQRSHIARLSEVALADVAHRTNPRPCTREDFVRLFEEAL